MDISITVHNVIICAIIPNSRQILAIRGEFKIDIHFYPRSTTPDKIKLEILDLKKKFDEENKKIFDELAVI